MSDMPGGYPNPPHTNGPPVVRGQEYGQPTYQAPAYPAQPQTYGDPAYGNPGMTGANVYGAVQPYSPAGQTYHPAVQPYSPAVLPAPSAQPAYPQVAGMTLVSAGGRLGGLLLDGLLILVTLWVGWLIWSMFTWSAGQTPAKRLLGHVVADPHTGAAFDWGRMAMREFCIKGLLGWLLNVVTIGIYFWVDAFMCLGDRQRTAHDRMANSVVRYR